MPKLILELQRDAMAGNCSASELLRKGLVVARKLKITEFETWVSHELNGYPPDAGIPKYREVVGILKAWNPYRGWTPIFIEDAATAQVFTRRLIGQAVGSLEVLVEGRERETLQVPFPPDVEARLMRRMGAPFKPTLHVSSNQVSGILDAIRNTVLNWALDLESRGILGEDMSFTDQEKQAAREIQTVNIENFQGVFGNVQDSTVTQNLNMNIRKGDFDSLDGYLRSIGVDADDVQELKKCVKSDPIPDNSRKLGPRVSSWIGKMVRKAASGGWQVALGTAGSLLAQAIYLYYGFP